MILKITPNSGSLSHNIPDPWYSVFIIIIIIIIIIIGEISPVGIEKNPFSFVKGNIKKKTTKMNCIIFALWFCGDAKKLK